MTAIDTYTNTPDLFNIQKMNEKEEELELKYGTPKKFLLKDFCEKNGEFLVKSDSSYTLCDKENVVQPLGIVWSVTSEQGYRIKNGEKTKLHDQIEDFHWPQRNENTFERTHPINGKSIKMYIMADGHGGHEAPQIFLARACAACFKVMEEKDWNLSVEEQQGRIKKLLEDTYISLDKQFCEEKVQEYEEYNRNGREGKKPVDDGCTLIVNIIYDGYLINVNTGDSRTVMGAKKEKTHFLHKKTYEFTPVFSSLDQSPDHPEKAYNVSNNGGIFLSSGGIPRKRPNIEPFEKRGMVTYPELVGSRIYRPSNKRIEELGINHLMTLNMGGSMGDLLFKIEPAVISCRPDVSIVKIDNTVDNMLLIATDGIWDHLNWQEPEKQNERIMSYISKQIGEDVEISEEILNKISSKLVKREDNLELYESRQRYDDCTAFLVFIPAGTEKENFEASS
ncbi:protein serine/threonine phosphatase 2C [Neocallimastix lanati (nom. inval.)]|jgi:serine/threonine protein phosphatase PrpC|uniref:Protein serine/threonine phosphatase 2C n=1 Tax=Neocallimastix californiae TaxID=1754190 RepID=A0A1Y2AWV5_9FUNG|nr:protein serine/threonine phosphatase 2C [Neocallimastix sp. JGI-2020a]ORY27041.1 protein serine/threonine phosphatase 2C [Neocallimastix californiae]|eukprot:ORY27041.1 protein serine/threonine phosphatase 2C [Neocallimastix californiae]